MGERSMEQQPGSNVGSTRRDTLRRFAGLGAFATIGAGVADLLGTAPARADSTTTPTNQLPATMVLNALPPGEQIVRAAIEATCCLTYTRDEGQCGSGGCGTGACCYHVTGSGGGSCNVNEIICVDVSCAEGNFTTGC